MMYGVGALLISLSCLLHQVSFIHTQVVPNSYFSSIYSVSLNGSHVGGGCSTTTFNDGDFCMAPTSSVLFDGVIPIINSTMWARQLLTFSTPKTLSITFAFMSPTSVNGTRIPFNGVSGIDIEMFNCPSRYHARTVGIVVKDNERIFQNFSFTEYTSCDHLIRISTSDNFYIPSNEITLLFIGKQGPPVHLIYLAEVTFYSIRDNHSTVGPIISSTSPGRNSTATTSTKITNASLNDKTTESVTTGTSLSPTVIGIIIVLILTFIIVCFILLVVVLLFLLYRKKTNKSGNSYGNVTKRSETEVGNRKSIENLSATDEIRLEVSGTDVYATVDKDMKTKVKDVVSSDMYTEIEDKGETKHPDISEMYAVVDKRSNKESKQVDTDTIAMHAMVDKKKKKNDDPEISQMYAVVDKTKKKKERKAAKVNSDAEIEDKSETKRPDISEMYAVVDKRSNKESKQVDIIAMYAMVDKTKKKKKVNDDVEISQMYAVVDKTKKNKERNAAKMNSDAMCSKATEKIDIDDLD